MALGPLAWIALALLGIPLRTQVPSYQLVLTVGILYPILEEMVFRGALQDYLLRSVLLKKSLAGISIACIITSMVFALAHLWSQSALWAALVFAPSIVFGWAYERYQHLMPPSLLHITYNLGFISLFSV